MRDSDTALRVYKRLLAFYPRDFRERVGSSMEQTFADNLRERRDRGGHVVAFLAWTFAETTLGIMKERTCRQKTSSVLAAVAGFVLVLPLMTLEWATSSNRPRTDFTFPLFVFLWLLAALFIRTFISVVRTALAMLEGHVAVLSSISLLPRIAFLGLSGWVWVSWVVDQMPCFLGASGC
jgi:hypothetical protein